VHQAGAVTAQDAQFGQAAAVGVADQVHHEGPGGRQLAVHGGAVETGRAPQCLDSGRDVLGAVGVQRAGPAAVTGVESAQQRHDLRPPGLADHQPVRTHPQRLAHQVFQRYFPAALDVGRTGLEPDHVRVLRAQFGGVLGEDDPLPAVHQGQQR
jgi:hypothetical protein